jgi:hypothetical protein
MHEITCIAMDDAGNSGRDATQIFIEPTPFADITNAGHDGPVTIMPTDHLKIRCNIDAAQDAVPGDYWLFVRTPSHTTWFWYDNHWTGQEIPWRQGKIEDIGPMTMMEPTGTALPGGEKGRNVFFWGTDTIADGSVNWSDFYYDTLTVVVGDGQVNTIILTRTSPDHIVTAGSAAKVFGTSGSNHITLEKGAKAELINFPGQNLIEIQSDAGLFTVSRSGTAVTFQGSDNTLLKIPATTDEQTLLFDGADPLILRIHENQVKLGEQVILFDD